MELLHDSIRGIHMLHWLTAAVPLATLVVVSGMVLAGAFIRGLARRIAWIRAGSTA